MSNSHRKEYLGVDLKYCKFIGRGTQGRVYLLPDGKSVIKIYKNSSGCRGEAEILLKVQNNPHFPKLYSYDDKCMIREYIGGTNIGPYLKNHGLSRNLAVNIINLIESFKIAEFKKLDIRFAHIFIQPDERIRVIDPRKVFKKNISYPRSIFGGLKKYGLLKQFMKILKEENPVFYKEWTRH